MQNLISALDRQVAIKLGLPDATTHMLDTLGVIFYEQRSIVTEFGFMEIP
jgi:hypothetical protein